MNTLSKKVMNWLQLPETKNIDSIDSPAATELRHRIIFEKVFLRRLYLDFYKEFIRVQKESNGSLCVELGSGGGFLKKVLPGIITSDILFLPHMDLNYSALKMPFKNNSIHSFFLLNVLHHMKDCSVFFEEVNRCLKRGGRVIMIEPANTRWGRFVYQNFHHEPFNPGGDWTAAGSGPLSCANGAIPWIIFYRDRKKFEQKFPALKIKRLQHHTPFRYMISGGVSMKALLPIWAYHVIKGFEMLLTPFNDWLGMFLTIEIEKVND